ncbi:hypothetical protein B0H14DRAFT_3678344 [Mycena olivaceomarginata]|nr:hypothetical protein B0H14DRAFT_3678344 [Mycena olivaceomarginata]
MECLEEGKGLLIRAGLQGGEMESVLMNIEAEVYLLKTEYSDARRIHEAILHQTSTKGSPVAHGLTLATIAFLDIVTGASADAVSRNLNAAITAFQNAHHARGVSWCEFCHADLLRREGDATGARAEYIRLFASARDRDDEIACYCLASLADSTKPVHADTESARWAVVFLAFALHPQVRSRLMVNHALRRLGDVLVAQAADETALNILTVALGGFTQMDVHRSRAECMRTIGDVYVGRGDLRRAREMWEAARPLFERSEQKKQVASIVKKLQALGVVQKLEQIPQVELLTPQTTLQDSGADSKRQKSGLAPELWQSSLLQLLHE